MDFLLKLQDEEEEAQEILPLKLLILREPVTSSRFALHGSHRARATSKKLTTMTDEVKLWLIDEFFLNPGWMSEYAMYAPLRKKFKPLRHRQEPSQILRFIKELKKRLKKPTFADSKEKMLALPEYAAVVARVRQGAAGGGGAEGDEEGEE